MRALDESTQSSIKGCHLSLSHLLHSSIAHAFLRHLPVISISPEPVAARTGNWVLILANHIILWSLAACQLWTGKGHRQQCQQACARIEPPFLLLNVQIFAQLQGINSRTECVGGARALLCCCGSSAHLLHLSVACMQASKACSMPFVMVRLACSNPSPSMKAANSGDASE